MTQDETYWSIALPSCVPPCWRAPRHLQEKWLKKKDAEARDALPRYAAHARRHRRAPAGARRGPRVRPALDSLAHLLSLGNVREGARARGRRRGVPSGGVAAHRMGCRG